MKKYTMALALSALSPLALAGNVLTNPGFEAPGNASGWTGFGGTVTLAATTADAQSGSQSLLVSGRTGSTLGAAQSLLGKLTAGTGYDVRAWVKIKQPVSDKVSLAIKQSDGAGTKYVVIDSQTVPVGQWMKLGGYFRYNPTGTATTLQLYLSGPAANVDFYVDTVAVNTPVAYTPPTASLPSDFLRASGRQLVFGAANTPVRLHGVNFLAYGDDSETADVVLNTHNYDEEDFALAKAAGFNVVRLNMWYKLFEDDAKPYVWKQEGWNWLDKQVAWARNAGIRLMFDMHAAQCGYQSNGYAGTFWNSGSACPARLQALWTAIATRYKHEPTVVGYDLLNEPAPPTNAQWVSYAQSLVNAIRAVDGNHLIIAEQSFASDNQPFLLTGGNVMYDAHFYEPWRYCAEVQYSTGYGDNNTPYPSPTVNVLPYSWTPTSVIQNPVLPIGTTAWTYYQGPMQTITSTTDFGAIPVLVSNSPTGKVWLDDFTVTEYDPAGMKTRVIHNVDVEKKPSTWYLLTGTDPFWSFTADWSKQVLSGSTATLTAEASGHRGVSSISLSAVNGKALLKNSKLLFAVRYGYSYQVSGWLKGDNLSGGSASLGLQLQKTTETSAPFTKAWTESMLLEDGLAYYRNANVPMNIGEFGVSVSNFANGRGGLTWMNDVYDLQAYYGVSGQMFNWHSTNFGIYNNLYGYPMASAVNQPLVDLIKAKSPGGF